MPVRAEAGPVFKVITVGNMHVGKSCLIHRYARGFYPGDNTNYTLTPEFMVKHTSLLGLKIQLKILDTVGQERFRSLIRPYYRDAHCVVFVYDVTDRESLKELNTWIREVASFCDPQFKVLVGTKVDLTSRRVVTRSEGEDFARKEGMDSFIEVSAKTGDFVENLFFDIAENLVQQYKKGMIESARDSVILRPPERDGDETSSLQTQTTTQPKKSFFQACC